MPAQYIRWSEGAKNIIDAFRRAAELDGLLTQPEALRAIMFRTPPDGSALGRVLRDRAVWPYLSDFIQGRLDPRAKGGAYIFDLEIAIEDEARQDGSLIVGERHIARWLAKGRCGDLAAVLITGANELYDRTRELELGPGFDEATLAGRWHGLLDAVVIVQCKDLDDILWLDEVEAKAVTLWVGTTLLNELDRMVYYHRSDRVRNRVGNFRRWLAPQLAEAVEPAGVPIREGVNLRVWAPPAAVGAWDSDHLQTAFSLRELGVDVSIVTQDLGLHARAITSHVPVHRLSKDCELPLAKAPAG